MAWKNGESAIIAHPISNGRKKATKKRKRRFPPEVLSPEEIAAMMDACSDTPAGIRNRALITVLSMAKTPSGVSMSGETLDSWLVAS